MTHVVKTADGGTFEPVLGEKARLLNEHTRHEIDEWIGRFPTGRHRSAVLSALPTALVYIFLGRFFIRGLLAGSMKG